MCRRCGDPVDPDAEICPSCGAIASPTAIRTSAYSTMSGTTKGLIVAAFVGVLGLAAYTLMPGSMHVAPADTTAGEVSRTADADRNRTHEVSPDSRRDASVSAALDAVRESIQRHDMESAKVLLAAILALHRDNPEALELSKDVKTSETQDKPAAPVARAISPPAKVVDARRTSTVAAAASHKPRSKSHTHEHSARASKKRVANTKASPHKVTTAKAHVPKSSAVQKPRVVVREAQVKQVRSDTPTRQGSSSDQNGPGSPAKPERWRDRGGMR